jgi:lambda repressor-like predicted transcriptional regulator
MDPLVIQLELKKRGITGAIMEKEIGRSKQHIGQVILKRRISDPVMRYVAEKIDRDYRRVFPEYYLKPAKRSTSKVSAA